MAPSSRSDLATIQTETSSVALITALSELEPEGRRFAFAADVDVMQPVRRADPALAQGEQISAVLAQAGLRTREEGETIHVERVVAENVTAPVVELAKAEAVESEASTEVPAQSQTAPVVSETVAVEAPAAPVNSAQVIEQAAAVLTEQTVMGTPVHHPKDRKKPVGTAVATAAPREADIQIADLIANDNTATKTLADRTVMGSPVVHKGDQIMAEAKQPMGRTPMATRSAAATARLANRTLMSGPVLSAGDRRPDLSAAEPVKVAVQAEPSNIEELIADSAREVEAEKADLAAVTSQKAEAQIAAEVSPVVLSAAESQTPAPEPVKAEAEVAALAEAPTPDQAMPVASEPAPVEVAQVSSSVVETAEAVAAPQRKSWGRKASAQATEVAPEVKTEVAAVASEATTTEAIPQTVAELIEANPAAAAPVMKLMRVPAQKPLQISTTETVTEPVPAPSVVAAISEEPTPEAPRRKSWGRKAVPEAEGVAAPLPLTAEPPQAEVAAVVKADEKVAPVMLEPVSAPSEIAKTEPPPAVATELAAAPVAELAAAPEPAPVKMAVPPIKPKPIVQAAVVMPDSASISDQVVTAVQSANAEAALDSAMGVDTKPERRSLKASKAVKMPDLWTAKRGATLRATLSDWCDRQGVQLIWRTEYDYPLAADVALEGNFETAVRKILLGFSAAAPQPVGRLHRQGTAGNAVLIISSRGNDYGEN